MVAMGQSQMPPLTLAVGFRNENPPSNLHQHQCLQSLHTLITMRSCRGNFRSSGAAAGGGASVAPRRAMPSSGHRALPRAPRRLLVPPDCQRPLAKESPIELAVRAGLWESVLAICLRTVCCWATCG